jgi:hypothetical protein
LVIVVPFKFKSFFGFDGRTIFNFAGELVGQFLSLLLGEEATIIFHAIVKGGNATVFKQDPEKPDIGVIYGGNI